MRHSLDADYLVVGAGASGLAFTDSLVDHSGAQVVIVDRRHGPGGHWLDAYPFVRLHQASVFYGVASTELGDGSVQPDGPEAGLHERANAPEICAYYGRVRDRLLRTGQVRFLFGCDYLGDGRIRSRVSGDDFEVRVRCRVVDARYREPEIPATTPPPFAAADPARVITVNQLVSLDRTPSQFVIVGSGKTATDACVWLLGNGVDPDRICWVRPRDPWMLNRAMVQPDPAVFLGMVADIFAAAAAAESLPDLFLRLEAAGVMLRIDRDVEPTMARTPTLAEWELGLLRSIENVVRLGHVRRVEPGAIHLDHGTVSIAADAVVVHCAAAGLSDVPAVPIWSESIIVQPIRSGFPCFGAALAGYVEATRSADEEKNRLCPSSPYPNSLADWARMTVLGSRASAAFGSEPDIHDWAQRCLLNPARIAPQHRERPEVVTAVARTGIHAEAGMMRLAQLASL